MVVSAVATSPSGKVAWDRLVPDLARLTGKSDALTREILGRQLAQCLCAAPCLHPALVAELADFQRALAARLAAAGLVDLAHDQPITAFLEYCYQQACYFYPDSGRAGQVYLERFRELAQLAAEALAGNQMPLLETALAEQAGYDAQQLRRAALTERRLAEAADAEFRALAAQQAAFDQINNKLGLCQLPDTIPPLLRDGLVGELQFLWLNQGGDAAQKDKFWRLWDQLLTGLAGVFDSGLDDQQVYTLVPKLLNMLELSQSLLPDPSQTYRQLTDGLADALAARIRMQALDLVTFDPLQSNHDLPGELSLTPTVARELEQLEPGGWYRVADEQNAGMRCKLAFKNPQSGSLLFADFTGRKVLHKSIQAFGLALSAGVIEPLLPDAVDSVLSEWLSPLAAKVEAARTKAAEAHTKASADAQKAQAMAQLRAAAKARAEAESLSANTGRPHQEVTPERLQTVAAQLDGAHVGALFGFFDDQGNRQKVKLSVIIKSTGKYIFADTLSKKWGEFARPVLLEKLASGEAEIITQGNLFEDQLARVITGIRRDLT